MTSLNPSHFPSSSSSHDDARSRGQAVHQSVSVEPEISSSYHPHHQQQNNSSEYVVAASSSEPSWKGAFARRQALKKAQQLERERIFQNDGDVDDQQMKESFDRSSLLDKFGFSKEETRKVKDHHHHHHHQRIQVPPIPDLRYEQGILMSIRPFLHRLQPTTSTTDIPLDTETILHDQNINPFPSHQERNHEERKEVEEKTAMVSSALTAEAARDGLRQGEQTDLFAGPLRFEWGKIMYVIFRDQFIYPLLQGLVWGVGGLWITSLWDWNKSRLEASAGAADATKRTAKKGVSPVSNWLARFGLKARS